MTVLVRLGAVESRRFGFELVKPSSVTVTGSGSETATVSALGSVEFTTCETLSLNGVFSSEYDNYMIVMRFGTSGGLFVDARLMSGASEANGANYTRQYLYADSTSVVGARSSSQTATRIGYSNNIQKAGLVTYVYGPHLAQPTAFRSVTALDFASAYIEDYASTHSLSTSYDGLKLIASVNNFSGRVAVYGMRG